MLHRMNDATGKASQRGRMFASSQSEPRNAGFASHPCLGIRVSGCRLRSVPCQEYTSGMLCLQTCEETGSESNLSESTAVRYCFTGTFLSDPYVTVETIVWRVLGMLCPLIKGERVRSIEGLKELRQQSRKKQKSHLHQQTNNPPSRAGSNPDHSRASKEPFLDAHQLGLLFWPSVVLAFKEHFVNSSPKSFTHNDGRISELVSQR